MLDRVSTLMGDHLGIPCVVGFLFLNFLDFSRICSLTLNLIVLVMQMSTAIHTESTSSCLITEVKQCHAGLVP